MPLSSFSCNRRLYRQLGIGIWVLRTTCLNNGSSLLGIWHFRGGLLQAPLYPLKAALSRGPPALSGGPGPSRPPHNSTTAWASSLTAVTRWTQPRKIATVAESTHNRPVLLLAYPGAAKAMYPTTTPVTVYGLLTTWYNLVAHPASTAALKEIHVNGSIQMTDTNV